MLRNSSISSSVIKPGSVRGGQVGAVQALQALMYKISGGVKGRPANICEGELPLTPVTVTDVIEDEVKAGANTRIVMMFPASPQNSDNTVHLLADPVDITAIFITYPILIPNFPTADAVGPVPIDRAIPRSYDLASNFSVAASHTTRVTITATQIGSGDTDLKGTITSASVTTRPNRREISRAELAGLVASSAQYTTTAINKQHTYIINGNDQISEISGASVLSPGPSYMDRGRVTVPLSGTNTEYIISHNGVGGTIPHYYADGIKVNVSLGNIAPPITGVSPNSSMLGFELQTYYFSVNNAGVLQISVNTQYAWGPSLVQGATGSGATLGMSQEIYMINPTNGGGSTGRLSYLMAITVKPVLVDTNGVQLRNVLEGVIDWTVEYPNQSPFGNGPACFTVVESYEGPLDVSRMTTFYALPDAARAPDYASSTNGGAPADLVAAVRTATSITFGPSQGLIFGSSDEFREYLRKISNPEILKDTLHTLALNNDNVSTIMDTEPSPSPAADAAAANLGIDKVTDNLVPLAKSGVNVDKEITASGWDDFVKGAGDVIGLVGKGVSTALPFLASDQPNYRSSGRFSAAARYGPMTSSRYGTARSRMTTDSRYLASEYVPPQSDKELKGRWAQPFYGFNTRAETEKAGSSDDDYEMPEMVKECSSGDEDLSELPANAQVIEWLGRDQKLKSDEMLKAMNLNAGVKQVAQTEIPHYYAEQVAQTEIPHYYAEEVNVKLDNKRHVKSSRQPKYFCTAWGATDTPAKSNRYVRAELNDPSLPNFPKVQPPELLFGLPRNQKFSCSHPEDRVKILDDEEFKKPVEPNPNVKVYKNTELQHLANCRKKQNLHKVYLASNFDDDNVEHESNDYKKRYLVCQTVGRNGVFRGAMASPYAASQGASAMRNKGFHVIKRASCSGSEDMKEFSADLAKFLKKQEAKMDQMLEAVDTDVEQDSGEETDETETVDVEEPDPDDLSRDTATKFVAKLLTDKATAISDRPTKEQLMEAIEMVEMGMIGSPINTGSGPYASNDPWKRLENAKFAPNNRLASTQLLPLVMKDLRTVVIGTLTFSALPMMHMNEVEGIGVAKAIDSYVTVFTFDGGQVMISRAFKDKNQAILCSQLLFRLNKLGKGTWFITPFLDGEQELALDSISGPSYGAALLLAMQGYPAGPVVTGQIDESGALLKVGDIGSKTANFKGTSDLEVIIFPFASFTNPNEDVLLAREMINAGMYREASKSGIIPVRTMAEMYAYFAMGGYSAYLQANRDAFEFADRMAKAFGAAKVSVDLRKALNDKMVLINQKTEEMDSAPNQERSEEISEELQELMKEFNKLKTSFDEEIKIATDWEYERPTAKRQDPARSREIREQNEMYLKTLNVAKNLIAQGVSQKSKMHFILKNGQLTKVRGIKKSADDPGSFKQMNKKFRGKLFEFDKLKNSDGSTKLVFVPDLEEKELPKSKKNQKRKPVSMKDLDSFSRKLEKQLQA